MKGNKLILSALITSIAFFVGFFVVVQTIFANNITSSVTVGNAAPTVSSVTLNGGSSITLTPNATTTISVNATIADNNGCGDVAGGTPNILLYRASVGSSTCLSGGTNSLNCYTATVFTASSTCSTTNVNTTTTFNVQYFAQPTDASSAFSGQGWRATVIFTDPSNATGSADSATTTLNSQTAINISTSSISYGILAASSTSAINGTTTISNVGNTSTTLNLSGTALTSGANHIATSSQHYATSTFTYGGSEPQLSNTPAAVPGFTLTAPTTTTNVSGIIYWGVSVPGGTPTGTYNATNTFTGVFSS